MKKNSTLGLDERYLFRGGIILLFTAAISILYATVIVPLLNHPLLQLILAIVIPSTGLLLMWYTSVIPYEKKMKSLSKDP